MIPVEHITQKHFLNIYDFINMDAGLTKIEYILSTNEDNMEIYICAESEYYFFCKNDIIKLLFKRKTDHNLIRKMAKSKFYVITGSSSSNDYKFLNTEFIYWDTFWFTETYNKLHSTYQDLPYQYHFVCLNGRRRNHRAKFIDNLYKEKLFDFGCISWLNLPHTTKKKSYEFKYWEPKILNLDLDSHLLNSPIANIHKVLYAGVDCNPPAGCNPPPQYNTSFIQIIVETSIDRHFITEKTIVPLMLNKPFLAFASKGYHKLLSNFGFQLYDEVFDYSFDEKENEDERIAGILENLKKIVSFDLGYCKNIYTKLAEKLEYNKALAIKIAKDKNLVPEVYLKHKKNMYWLEKNLNSFEG